MEFWQGPLGVMPAWQWGLVLLGVLWALQALGTWRQMRHYRQVMQAVLREEPEGYLGTGAARGVLAKGVIVLLVAGPDLVARRVLLMEGRSVLAGFRRAPELEGLPLDALETRDFPAAQRGRAAALRGAIAQIRKAAEAPALPEPSLSASPA
ncbi:glucitol operon activator protein [Teichococcus cervicalis]|uniref:Glucitol operon activator protein (GutM) n=1 Tax=Pseudoroseomonas cervicalis ATCC 49957 TaxID=525371 RepID=D5RGN3_9PROT|nr:glucitol operon activator protein [Pseudoroseomonas cervicalis]EFH13534.1 glucitol operon activator protein (GutM) [Pseudoroseomonas cervicalis ATCC 49957]